MRSYFQSWVVFWALACGLLTAQGAPISLFNGRDLTGWTVPDKESWRVEDGSIVAGSVQSAQAHYAYLVNGLEFENFELTLRYRLDGTDHVNSGVYFRAQVPGAGHIAGYQADMGEGFDGGLYEEGRGRGMLFTAPADKIGRVVKKGDWNDFRIRTEGRRIRIWVNGELVTDYLERKTGIPHRGMVALELMSGLLVEELPDSPESEWETEWVEGPPARITEKLDPPPVLERFKDDRFALGTNEVVVFMGPENMVIEQRTGWLETALADAYKDVRPRFRSMGWEGDTVYRQNRMMNWGSWKENLDAVGATTVFLWFGQLEAFDDDKSLLDFMTAYGELIKQVEQRTPRVVLIAPTPFEKPADSRVPDNTPRNETLRKYNDAIRTLAVQYHCLYVDAFLPPLRRNAVAGRLTRDGIHLTDAGMWEVAGMIAKELRIVRPVPKQEPLRRAIAEKNRLWFDTWRPMNWAFAYGDRTTQPFAQAANNRPALVDELTRFRTVMAQADAEVHAVALNQPRPEPLPHDPPRADPPAPTPEEEMSRFQIRQGFAVNLFADEKLGVIRPLQIRWDEQGRLWVLCAPSYPQLQLGEKANDYLIVLEDTDGDGRADKVTRVAEGLTMPMGFEFGDDGIYICDNTQLIHLRDTDGDGTGDTHQTINSVRWGADGALWFTQGYHIWSSIETPHGIVELNRSGLWRYNPRTRELHSYLNESTAGLNCWGVTFDDFGQVFHGSGADFVIWHSTPALIPTLHPLNLGAGFAGSKGKSMEPEFLGSSHLPPDLQGVLMKSVYYTSQVRLYRLRDDGAGFASEDLGDLLASTGNEFRPVESRVGPDGAIYVCDWLNPVIGHYQASYRDPRRDHSHGRVWRVTAQGRELVPRPALEKMNAAGLVAQLKSPERWVREQALYRKPKAETVAAADKALAGESGQSLEGARLLYELSGVFAAHEEARAAIMDKLFASDDFRWRAWAAHLAGVWARQVPDPLAYIRRAVTDSHPRVRMEGVVAASYIPSAEAIKVATLAMDRPMDTSVDYALTQCIHALARYWQPAMQSGKLDFGDRFGAMARVLTTSGDTNVVARVREMVRSGKAGAARDGLLSVLIEYGGPSDMEFAINQGGESKVVLDSLIAVAFRKQDQGYHVVLEQLLTSRFPIGRIAGCRVATAWGQDFGQLPRIRKIAFDESSTIPERAAAVTAIARIRGRESLPELLPLTANPDVTLRLVVLEALAPFDSGTVATRSVELLAKARSADEAGRALSPLLGTKDGATVLAKGITEQRLAAPSARLALQWLQKTGHDEPALTSALNAAAGLAGDRLEYSPALVAQLIADARTRGDARRGNEWMHSSEMACLGCHRIGNEGGVSDGPPLAPELTAIGRAMTPELIVEAVLWPKRQVKEGFLLTQVTTRDGHQYQGYKSSENLAELRLRQVDGTEVVLRKPEIQKRTDDGTLMPEGLLDALDAGQRLDVLRYLLELGR